MMLTFLYVLYIMLIGQPFGNSMTNYKFNINDIMEDL